MSWGSSWQNVVWIVLAIHSVVNTQLLVTRRGFAPFSLITISFGQRITSRTNETQKINGSLKSLDYRL
jgi:hypothetical protein